MPQPIDFCELGLDILSRYVGWVIPEKYFTLSVDMIVGAVLRSIFNLYAIFSLRLFEPINYGLYIFYQLFSALFMKYEVEYIFGEKSKTEMREILYKIICLANDFYQFFFLFVQGEGEIIELLKYGEFTWSGIYEAILAFLFVVDFFQLLIFTKCCCCCCCSNKNLDYTTKGQAEHFVKFRLIGGITGIIFITISIIRIDALDSSDDYKAVFILLYVGMGSEVLILIRCIVQLWEKRSKEQFAVSYKSAIEQQLSTKKWYCIIIGFTYGLFEVPAAIFIIIIDYAYCLFCSFFCCRDQCGTQCCIEEIIEYEIVLENQLQEEQLTIKTK